MAITTVDGLIAGAQPPRSFKKANSPTLVIGREWTPLYTAGIPGPAVANATGMSGAALTSYLGQIPFTNPGAGNTYLGRLAAFCTQYGSIALYDRLWHQSGINLTLTTSQTINSAALPARDVDGATAGNQVIAALEFSATGGAGTPTLTLGYTNSAGTAGRTANLIQAATATPGQGFMFFFGLQAGDVGIQSIQTYQQSATWTSGTAHLVLLRKLAQFETGPNAASIDAVRASMSRMHDNCVPQLVWTPAATTAMSLDGTVSVHQG